MNSGLHINASIKAKHLAATGFWKIHCSLIVKFRGQKTRSNNNNNNLV